VVRTRVGYAGGTTAAPTYSRLGDHTETIEFDYDPSVVTYAELLDEFWRAHDPRRHAHSRQYRSAIFYRTDEERREAEESKARIESVIGTVTTAIESLERFHRAEDYHQKYRLRAHHRLMVEFRKAFPDDDRIVDSTAAARVNGWLDGYGSPDEVRTAASGLGLSDAGTQDLLAAL
jgi:peptide-methionine (S)-S-oxide reductase